MEDFEDYIYSIFDHFIETGENSLEIDVLTNYLISKLNLNDNCSISFPINMYLYEILCEMIVHLNVNAFGEYSETESTLVFDTLSSLRRDWNISNIFHNIAYLSSLFRYSFYTNDFDLQDKLYSNLLYRIKTYQKVSLEKDAKHYLLRVLSIILKGYSGNFIDIFSYYLGDFKTLKDDLSLYNVVLGIWCKLREEETKLYPDVVSSDCFKTILNQTLEKSYQNVKLTKKCDNELDTLVSMLKDFSQQLKYQQEVSMIVLFNQRN
jgi:hypothetical protein